MKRLDPIKSQYGALSPHAKHLVRSYTSNAANLLDKLLYFFSVYEAAEELCAALAADRLAYEKQGALEMLLAAVPK